MANNPPVPVYEPPSYGADKDKNPQVSAGYNTNTYGFNDNNFNESSAPFNSAGFDDQNVRQRFVKKVTGILVRGVNA